MKIIWTEADEPCRISRIVMSANRVQFELRVEFRSFYNQRRKLPCGFDIDQPKFVLDLAGVTVASWPTTTGESQFTWMGWFDGDLEDASAFLHRSLECGLFQPSDIHNIRLYLSMMQEELAAWRANFKETT